MLRRWLVTYAPGGYLEKLHNVWFIKVLRGRLRRGGKHPAAAAGLPCSRRQASFAPHSPQMFTKACTSLLRVRLIIARVDLAVAMYPGVVAAPLLLGTVAGCGGRLLADLVMWGWTPPNR